MCSASAQRSWPSGQALCRAPLVVGEQAVVPANLVDDVDPSALVAQHFAQYEPEREAVGRQQLEVGGALGTLVAPQDVLGDGKAVVSCKASAGQAAIHPVRPAEHTRRVRHDAVNKKVSLQPCVCVQHWFEFAAAKTKCRNLQPLSTLNPATTVDGNNCRRLQQSRRQNPVWTHEHTCHHAQG